MSPDTVKAGVAPEESALLLRPLRQASRLVARRPEGALLGRNHRAPETRARLALALERTTRELLELPAGYLVAIVPASDTGAVEMALWSLLGPRGVDVLAWEAFSRDWVTDIVEQFKLKDVRALARAVRRSARPRAKSISIATWCSRGTARHLACACRTRSGSQATGEGSPSAMRPLPCSRKGSTGRSSMPRPSPGRRCWAGRRSTGC